MTRVAYDRQLANIEADFVRMGSTACDMIGLSVQVIMTEDMALYKEVQKMEQELDRLEQETIDTVIRTTVRESPVAHDLLFLTATIAILGEIEKTGDDALKLARRGVKLKVDFPEEMKGLLTSMCQETTENFRTALRLYTKYSPAAAADLIDADDKIDNAYKTSRGMLLQKMSEQPEFIRQYFRCSEIFHALEHIGDHAVGIAKTLRMYYERD